LLEVFLVKRVPAWSRNISSRATTTPKLAFVDSGIAAHQIGADTRSILRPTGQLGPLFEGFVLMELARQLTWCEEEVALFHYRTRDQYDTSPSGSATISVLASSCTPDRKPCPSDQQCSPYL
jgi:uncharacterized protein